MRIQEMKSGLAYLKKRGIEQTQNVFYGVAAGQAMAQDPQGESTTDTHGCELDEPRWSVVSFVRREASGLTYHEAAGLMYELDAHGVPGLCVLTDESAAHVG